jgi:putative acetyltransferase
MITIRRATESDRPAIARVHIDSIRGLTHTHYSPAQIDAWSAGKSPEKYPLAAHEFYVAVIEGGVVGFAELIPQSGEVRAVYVAPEAARRGVGTRLLTTVVASARAHGVSQLKLGASLNAVPFYERHGFALTADPLRYTADGAPYHLMQRSLL